MTLWMAKYYNCHITRIDIDSHHIEIARMLKEKHGMDQVDFLLQNVVENPIDEKFDYIFLNDVAEHIRPDYLVPIFTQLGKQLKKDGVIFVSYPPWEGPYASHRNPKMVKGIITEAGLQIERRLSQSKINRGIKGLNRNFWPLTFLITKEIVALKLKKLPFTRLLIISLYSKQERG